MSDSTPTPDHLAKGTDETLVEVSPVVTTVHHPGQPLETERDREAQVDDLYLREGDTAEPLEYAGLNTSSPELNYASRSNIVPPSEQ